MFNFMVRVELHGATSADYTNLHAAMLNAGFSRLILGADGRYYQLPTAEYIINSSFTVEQVRHMAFTTASTVSANPAVIAVRFDQSAWGGLSLA